MSVTNGPSGPGRNRWTIISGEQWQQDTGEEVAMQVSSAIGELINVGFTLEEARELHSQLGAHLEEAEDPCTYTFAHTREWCGHPLCRES